MKKIVLASNNKHKLDEFSQIFNQIHLPISLITPNDINLSGLDVDETGDTFEENSEIKAKSFFEAAGIPAIADDSGLEVDCLDKNPGVQSARYAGTHGNDAANRLKVLEEIIKSSSDDLTARFRCVICYYDGVNKIFANGSVEGRISLEERGAGGFGYDPIFIPDGFEQTFAELPQIEKNKISHRGKAIQDFVNKYKKIYAI